MDTENVEKKSVAHVVADKVDVAGGWIQRNAKKIALGATLLAAAGVGAVVAAALSNKAQPVESALVEIGPGEELAEYTEVAVEETAQEGVTVL